MMPEGDTVDAADTASTTGKIPDWLHLKTAMCVQHTRHTCKYKYVSTCPYRHHPGICGSVILHDRLETFPHHLGYLREFT